MLGGWDTIYALSSGGLPSGVAVVRVSGRQAAAICEALCGSLPAERDAALLSIRDRNGALIDRGLVLYFKGPRSFTGEDCLEFQLHGGRAVVARLLATLSGFPDTRHAEAGEFTRRAFDNGKIDLVETEGLADLIVAETEMQHRLALEQSRGALTEVYHGWAKRILHARAMIEAELDFSDEGDIPGSVSDRVWADMSKLHAEVLATLANIPLGEIIRDGLNVVIVGRPNVGKSSLMNYLAGRDVAIVTDIAGTTRDMLQVDLNIDGYLVHLKDTAGLRHTDDIVESEGIRRALGAAERADVVLQLFDLSDMEGGLSLDVHSDGRVIRVGTKADRKSASGPGFEVDVEISVKSGTGIDSLMERIVFDLKERAGAVQGMVPSRSRHRSHLDSVVKSLEIAIGQDGAPLEIRAEHLRLASDSLGRITGRTDVEMLLGVIFSEFCVGK